MGNDHRNARAAVWTSRRVTRGASKMRDNDAFRMASSAMNRALIARLPLSSLTKRSRLLLDRPLTLCRRRCRDSSPRRGGRDWQRR
jgi:hypothetical protein